MRTKLGNALMFLGAALLLGALLLFGYNRWEMDQAGRAANAVMPQLVEEINAQEADTPLPDPYRTEMTRVEIDGYDYIGYLYIPALELELPVMADWDYARLKVAPCRWVGSTFTDDLVVMAHNYERHFGKLSQLTEGDSVIFTDMDGVRIEYQVVARDVVAPTAVDELTSGAFDLTLFTCTYGGRTRVVVYCDRVAG